MRSGVEATLTPTGSANSLLSLLDRLLGTAAALLLTVVITVLLANVVGRYLFDYSLTWAAELAQWAFIGMIFLGIPLAHRARLHLAITLLTDHLPHPLDRFARLIADAVVAYTTIALLMASLSLIERIGGVNHALQLPAWAKFAVIPLSCALGLLYLLLRDREAGSVNARGDGLLAVGLALLVYLAFNQFGWLSLPRGEPGVVLMLSFFVALALGVPVAFAMLFSAFSAQLAGALLPPPAIVQTAVNGAGKFLLLAVPLFLTAGALMNSGGLTRRLIDFAFTLVGHLRGGLAQVNVLSSLLYGGISGSSYSEAALSAKLLVPQMTRHGYSPAFACATSSASAILPNIVPPSIALLILASVANLSVGDLWLAGIGPGLVIAACLMSAVYGLARYHGFAPAGVRARGKHVMRSGLRALPVLALAVLILGGIRFGIVTPTEAGVLAVTYALLLGLVVYREYGLRALWQNLQTSAIEAALVGLLIGAAAPFAFVLVTNQVPQTVAALLTTLSDNPYFMLLLLNGVMLVFGMFLDIGAAILILTPLLMPLATSLGIDPVHFALVIVVNLMLGGITPPVGMLAFITGGIAGVPVHAVFRALLPYLAALIVALLLVSYIPAIALMPLWLFE